MSKLFNGESPVISFLSRIADLIIVNVITMIFAAPFLAAVYYEFILTVQTGFHPGTGWISALALLPLGMGLAALNYVLLKMVRKEEGYLLQNYFKGLKDNFLNATILWIVFIILLFLVFTNLCLIFFHVYDSMSMIFFALVAAAFVLGLLVYAIPLTARYVNTTFETLKNAFILMFMYFPRTIAMILTIMVPPVMIYFFGIRVLPLILILGISGPWYVIALLYNDIFKKLEKEM